VAVVAAALLLLPLCGCASAADTSAATGNNDPYESTNRQIFELNQNFDHRVARPVAVFYSRAMPRPARDGIHNVLVNIGLPVVLANDILQGDATRAKDTLGRLVVNSTVGIAGLVDVAGRTGIPEHASDFGETLAHYGVEEGPYLVLPMLGPSDVRDAIGYGVDVALDPATWVGFRSAVLFKTALRGTGVIDARVQNIGVVDELESGSVDLYATERSAFRQNREAKIRRGKPDVKDLPDF
jgi:phospholipid-binding lipoprotein MlaA